ncbi:MAG: UDP-N-acetylmuramate dehydrogenase [Alcanivoracaceae bacterium]
MILSDVAVANTLRLPAVAAHYVLLQRLDDLADVLTQAQRHRWPLTVVGEGSNLVLRSNLPGLVIRPAMRGMQVVEQSGADTLIECQAGESWDTLVRWSLAQGLAGLENLSLIPGSVGAAPFQNIGAYGVELADLFDSLEACSLDTGERRRFSLQECCFGYRDSLFKTAEPGRWLIASLRLRLSRHRPLALGYADLQARFEALPREQHTASGLRELICALRRSKLPDPAELANAGSFFKNPVISASHRQRLLQQYPDMVSYLLPDGRFKLAAGWLIERAGWKGKRMGELGMHASQALVLANYGAASGEQVLAFADQVRRSVQHLFDVVLEQEPVILPR